MSRQFLREGMAAAHKGIHDRLFRPDKHPEAFLGFLGGMVTSLYGEDMAFWHAGATADDGTLGQQYKLGLARGRELVKDAKHLGRSDREILSLKQEVDDYSNQRNQPIEDLKKSKSELVKVTQQRAEIEAVIAQAKEGLDYLLEQHRSLKEDNFNREALSEERIRLLKEMDQLRADVSQLQLERRKLVLDRPVEAAAEKARLEIPERA